VGKSPPCRRISPDCHAVGTVGGGESGRLNAFDPAKVEPAGRADRTPGRAASLAA